MYLTLETEVEGKFIVSQLPVFENRNESLENRNFKMPKIEVENFLNDAKVYMAFCTQFQTIRE